MENIKEQLEKEKAESQMNTLNKKADVAKAQAKETIADVKLGVVNLEDKATHKASNLKEDAKETWENVKNKAGDIYDDAQEKAAEIGEKIGDKYDEMKAKATQN